MTRYLPTFLLAWLGAVSFAAAHVQLGAPLLALLDIAAAAAVTWWGVRYVKAGDA